MEWLEQQVRELMQSYAYRNIRTPIVEPTPLFVRGLGEVTDIVEKEMYAFVDHLNGEHLCLRPEATAGVVRAAIEHNLLYDGGKRLYYIGPMFRHERPQKGRYRQFHQIGAEVLGFPGPETDAELILMAHELWQRLGLSASDVELEVNSLGQPSERQQHRVALINYFHVHADVLAADSVAQRRIESNPLRILDSKNPALQEMLLGAPKLLDFLGTDSRQHLDAVLRILDAHKLPYQINPRLVRGMDYYNRTVFEFVTAKLGAQSTICGGGRYDHLVQLVGGKPTPAVGWALGVERVLELVRQGASAPQPPRPDIFAVIPEESQLPQAMVLLQQLRSVGLHVQMHARPMEGTDTGLGSMKSQFKRADASGARYALVCGQSEWAMGQVLIKSLRDGQGQQRTVSRVDWRDWAALVFQESRLPVID